jgi:hypothetical protein
MPLALDGKSETGKDGLPIHDDGTYTAGAYIAPLFGSYKSELIPQHIKKCLPGIYGNFIAIAVYVQG